MMGHNSHLAVRGEVSLNMRPLHVKNNVQIQGNVSEECDENILVNRSVMQVFHNSTHKVASGRVPAKISCPYLGRAHRYIHTHAHAHRIMGYKERRQLKEREEGEEWHFRQRAGKFCFQLTGIP